MPYLCHSYVKHEPHWLPTILIILVNDIHLNPGPHYQTNFLNFMSWNLNTITKDNFEVFDSLKLTTLYSTTDLISICETSLNNSVELSEILLNDYSFVSANNSTNTRHGGVGLFYKKILYQS